MIKIIIFINGIYDIICSLSILFTNNYFSNIHPKLFKDKDIENNVIIRRLLAYWIFTYGILRVFGGYYRNSKELLLLAYY